MEVEITRIPPLSDSQLSQIEMHSLLNILNVLKGELALIGLQLANDAELLEDGHDLCDVIKKSFTDRVEALRFAGNVKGLEERMMAEINRELQRRPDMTDDAELRESLANIHSVFQILEVRAAETLAAAREPARWVDFEIAALHVDFRAVFSAIEKNSHGRYRVIYNVARQQSSDYYIDFVVDSADGRTISMPLAFKDVVRDLAANARKYTRPGGAITIGLYESPDELRFVVQDTGCGIPADEIERVVQYGERGSNVHDVRTMGAGFGLTKAFLVTKRFGGKLWIRSEVGIGTRITITLPRTA